MKDRLAKLISTAFYVGYFPKAPGTMGSLWGVLIFFLLQNQPRIYLVLFAIIISLIGIIASNLGEKIFNEKDSQKIVIDEVAGQLITYLLVPYSIENLILGFILFRLFDILKIFPANWAQNNLPKGYGVMGDDIIAGIQAGGILFILHLFFQFNLF
jgi:phosphatidylglycerophosphatase A